MTRILLIDDEPSCLHILKEHFKILPNYKIVGCAATFDEAVNLTVKELPELVFLDIELGDNSGFDYLEQFKNAGFSVVITTAYLEHSLRAIKLSALGFLLKPFTTADFSEVLHKYETESKQLNGKRIEVLLNNIKHPGHMKINILVNDGIIFIDVKDIVRCQASGSYTEIYLDIKKRHIVSSPLKVYEEQLEPSGFYRVHRSHLINLHKIDKFLNTGFAIMKDGSEVEVATRRKAEFLRRLGAL
ncbi:MAG TPA: response regulator transcription factor [Leeuwenhoekiella sp.]|nr:response regulator transcription factor [Leeuwenhoekiella sp.]